MKWPNKNETGSHTQNTDSDLAAYSAAQGWERPHAQMLNWQNAVKKQYLE